MEGEGGLNRCLARYGVTEGFRSISIDGPTETTVLDHTSGLRVYLAYSALQTLAGALPELGINQIGDGDVATRFRSRALVLLIVSNPVRLHGSCVIFRPW